MIKEFVVETKKKFEVVDITEKVNHIVKEGGVKEGICIVYVPHATAAVIINEGADPNIGDDFLKEINKIVVEHDNYKHDLIDNNAAAHIKSAMLGPSETIIVKDNKPILGTWQNIFLVELDGPRRRNVVVFIK